MNMIRILFTITIASIARLVDAQNPRSNLSAGIVSSNTLGTVAINTPADRQYNPLPAIRQK